MKSINSYTLMLKGFTQPEAYGGTHLTQFANTPQIRSHVFASSGAPSVFPCLQKAPKSVYLSPATAAMPRGPRVTFPPAS